MLNGLHTWLQSIFVLQILGCELQTFCLELLMEMQIGAYEIAGAIAEVHRILYAGNVGNAIAFIYIAVSASTERKWPDC